jgi:hypothetical protein
LIPSPSSPRENNREKKQMESNLNPKLQTETHQKD